jgi:23S rRNA pseudouridine1911/1915/1917 synthase
MQPPKDLEATVDDPACSGMRVDAFLSERLALFSRSQARSRVVSLRVNGQPARLGKKLKLGDRISLAWAEAPGPDVLPQDIPLSIIFENADVIVVDKPQGMVVHPGSGNAAGTLVNALLFHCEQLAERFGAGDTRPGIVHRLDKDTSGVIIVAKNPGAHDFLARQFQARTVKKRYVAIVKGRPSPATGSLETRIARDPRNRKRFTCVRAGGRLARTSWKVIRSVPGYSLVALFPHTGRTHQLRVHLRHLRTPVLGDPLYARRDAKFPDATLMLHARRLSVVIPGEKSPRVFESPLPARMVSVLSQLTA